MLLVAASLNSSTLKREVSFPENPIKAQGRSQTSGLMPGNGWTCSGCGTEVFHIPLSVLSLGSGFLCGQRCGGHRSSLDIAFSETLLKIFLDYAYAISSYLGVNLPKRAIPGKKCSHS